MASFTDQIPTFNPYISQLPVDAMVKVGMEKQRRYDEGIQKIQTSVDQIAGLDVVRDVDKAYLQSKVNELGNNLKTFMASDFSDYQLVNSVAGMTGQISKDPKVLNAVNSTMKYRKEVGLMEEDRKKGTLAPENEVYFSKQARPWLDSSDVSESFSGKYIPYFDVFKHTKEVFDSVKPDGYSFDQIFQTDGEGNLRLDKNGTPILSMTMKRLEKEGLFPEKVRETLNQVFSDPRVSRQLNITGQYTYSGLDESQLKQRVLNKKENDTIDLETKLLELKLKQNMGKEDHSLEIDKLEDAIEKINLSYDEMLETDNLDGLRGSLYRQDVYGRYQKMFGYTKTKEQVMDNPQFKMEFEINKAAQERADRLRSYNLEVEKFEETKKANRLTDERERMKIIADANKNKPGTGGPSAPSVESTYDTARNELNMAESKYTAAANNSSTAKDLLIYNTLFNNESAIKRVQEIMNSGEGISKNKAINLFLKQEAAKLKMTIEDYRNEFVPIARKTAPKNPYFQDLKTAEINAQKILNQEHVRKQQREEQSSKLIKELGLDKTLDLKTETITYRGKNITLNKQDQLDIAIYMIGKAKVTPSYGEDVEAYEKAAASAKKRLDNKGLGEIAERALQQGRTYAGIRNPISGVVGLASTTFSDLRDFGNMLIGDDTKGLTDLQKKLYKLSNSIYDKTYDKVIDSQKNIIRNQYGINPNRAWSLTTGDSETDRSIEANLSVDYNLFLRGKKQNLATDEEFENFGKALNSKDSKFAIESTTDENGNPTFSVTTTDSEGNFGKMVLNADMAAKYGFTASDIFEPQKVEYIRGAINLYGGKTSVGNPYEISTYTSGAVDYVYDRSDFINLKNPKYDVKVNIAEFDGKFYGYIYMTDGEKETIFPSEGKSNLSQLNAIITSTVDDAFVKIALSKVK